MALHEGCSAGRSNVDTSSEKVLPDSGNLNKQGGDKDEILPLPEFTTIVHHSLRAGDSVSVMD